MELSAWQQAGAYFTYQGQRYFYRVEGEGPALLLLHGFPTASWDWAKIWPLLVPHYRVYALDFLGCGFSDKPRHYAYSVGRQADAVEALTTHLGMAKTHVLAHDYGDTVAQELIARSQEQSLSFGLESVTFLNGGMFPETHRPLLVQRLLMSPLGPWVSHLFTKDKLTKNFHRIFGPNTLPTTTEMDAFWALLTHNEGRRIFHLLIRYMRERQRHRARWVGGVQTTKIPLLLINGLHDPISGEHMVERYCALVPDPQVVRLPTIGHYPQIEAPNKVVEAFLAFQRSLQVDKNAYRTSGQGKGGGIFFLY